MVWEQERKLLTLTTERFHFWFSRLCLNYSGCSCQHSQIISNCVHLHATSWCHDRHSNDCGIVGRQLCWVSIESTKRGQQTQCPCKFFIHSLALFWLMQVCIGIFFALACIGFILSYCLPNRSSDLYCALRPLSISRNLFPFSWNFELLDLEFPGTNPNDCKRITLAELYHQATHNYILFPGYCRLFLAPSSCFSEGKPDKEYGKSGEPKALVTDPGWKGDRKKPR